MSLAAALWTGSRDLAAQALRHPFVRGLADGTLPTETFGGYVAQDRFFLTAFARAYALTLARSEDTGTLLELADLLGGVRDELRLHDGYARRWGVDMDAVTPAPATLAYTDFLLATAATGSTGLVCAAMTPCMRLYAFLGASLATGPVAPAYAEWVAAYAEPGFASLAAQLERLLDRHVRDEQEAAAVYRRAMRLELAFFQGALEPDGVRSASGG